jgi:hypothetical protein
MLRTSSNRANGRSGSADGTEEQARETDLLAIGELTRGNLDHVPTRCVVLVAPSRQLPLNEERVTDEGGLIRFGLGASKDREVRAS